MKHLVTGLLFFLLAGHSVALDQEEIREIAKQPHSREGLLEELKIYPDARQYDIKLQIHRIESGEKSELEFRANEHIVGGKYLVNSFQIPGSTDEVTLLFTFDREAHVYRRWTLLPGGQVTTGVGTALPEVNAISWYSEETVNDMKIQVLGIEHQSDRNTTWKEVHLVDGQTKMIVEGTAVPVKE